MTSREVASKMANTGRKPLRHLSSPI